MGADRHHGVARLRAFRNVNTDVVKQGRLSAQWKQDDFTIKLGGDYIDDHYLLTPYGFGTSNFSQAYAGYGPFGQSARPPGVKMPASLFTGSISLDNFIPAIRGTYRRTCWSIMAGLSPLSGKPGNPQTKNIPGFSYSGVPTFYGKFDLSVNPGQHPATFREQTWGPVPPGEFRHRISPGMPFHFSAGVREEHTNLSSSRLQPPADDHGREQGRSDADDGDTGRSDRGHDEERLWLPPAQPRHEAGTDQNKLHLRFDASRTITRPALSVLNAGADRADRPAHAAPCSASGGNPVAEAVSLRQLRSRGGMVLQVETPISR